MSEYSAISLKVNNILGSIAYPLPDDIQGPAVEVLVSLSGQADKEAPLSQQQDFVAGTLATTVSLMKVRIVENLVLGLALMYSRTKSLSSSFCG